MEDLCMAIKILFFGLVLISQCSSERETGRCPKVFKEVFETNCTSCHINVFVDCPDGSVKTTTMEGNAGCTFEQHLGPGHNIHRDGCSHTCERQVQEPECCRGFWGSNCGGNIYIYFWKIFYSHGE